MTEISDQVLEQIRKMDPGDYAVYCVEDNRLNTLVFSDGLPGLSGLTADAYRKMTEPDAAAIVLETDRPQIAAVLSRILRSRNADVPFSVTYRIFHKQYGFIWVRARARMLGTREGKPVIIVSFATMAAESHEYANLLNNDVTSIYVVDKKTHELLFANQAAMAHNGKQKYQNEKCYRFFNNEDEPYPWCSLPTIKDGHGEIEENYVPSFRKWYSHYVHDLPWYGHEAAAFYITDITRQKERQASYEERFNNLYREIATAYPNAMAMFRLNLTKNTCSGAQDLYHMTGLPQELTTADGCLRAFADAITDEKIRRDCETRFSLQNMIREFHNGVTEMSIQYPISGKAGNTIWINGAVVMMQNTGTDDIEGVAYAVNITDQKTNETILAKISEEKYDHIGLISRIQRTYELWKNDKALDLPPHDMVNYDEVFRKILEHYILAEDRPLFEAHGKLENIVASLERNGRDSFVYRYMDASGRCVYKQVTYVWLDSQKDLILETQTDLTDLYEKQIEQVKLEHEAALARERALSVESIPSGVGVFDLTDGRLSLNYINSGFYQMLGIPPEEKDHYFDQNAIHNVYAEDRRKLNTAIAEAIRKKEQLTCRIRIADGGKRPHWVEVVGNHIALDDHTERFYVSYYDVDRLIRIQNELQEKELTYRDILSYSEIIHFTYYIAEHQYRVAVLPEKYRKLPRMMDNYPASFIDLVHLSEKDRDAYQQMIQAIDSGASEAECKVFMNFPGVSGWYRVHLIGVADDSGHIFKAIGNVFNVDSAVEAERAISEERFRMESLRGIYLATACFSVKKDQEIVFNRTGQLSRSAEIDQEELAEVRQVEPAIDRQDPGTLVTLLSAIRQIPDPGQRAEFIRTCSHAGMLRKFSEGKRDVTLEYRRFVGDKLIWVSTRVILMEEPSTGDILAFYYTRDINKEKQNDQIRRLALEKQCDYAALLNVREKTLSFHGDAHIDRTFCHGFDRTGDNPYEESVRNAIRHSFDDGKGKALLQSTSLAAIMDGLKASAEYSVIYDWEDKDGSWLRKQILYQWLDETKEDILVIESDITQAFIQERQKAQQLQNALETAEKANHAKTEFLSRISHDIRTPIGAIQNMTAFAREDADDHEKLRHDLDRIEASNTLLLSLINDVLDISKIDSGKIELHPEPYPYDEYIENIRNIFEPLCQQNGLTLVIRGTGEGHGHAILVDRVRYNQIALNLLSNAVKYTPAGGTITYTTHAEKQSDGMVHCWFEVADTGIGMSEEFQKKMFEPFSQELDNPARTGITGGTGLGLSIVKRLVDLMDGKLTVESRIGKGTKITVSFRLPEAASEKAEPEKSAAPGSYEQLSGKVLLAEDNAINTEIATRILSSFGLTVVHAENGKKAVEIFEASDLYGFQAVLMDIQMPVMNGYEAASAIRALVRPDHEEVPIIAMTADAFEESIQRARQAGMVDYVTKPVDPHKLYEILARAIRGAKGQ